MRAPYNTTFDAYLYPIGGFWGPPVAVSIPGRIVDQDELKPAGGFLDGCDKWLTTDADLGVLIPVAIGLDGAVAADLGASRGIAYPSGGAPAWVVLQVFRCLPGGQSPYWRYWLRPYPLV